MTKRVFDARHAAVLASFVFAPYSTKGSHKRKRGKDIASVCPRVMARIFLGSGKGIDHSVLARNVATVCKQLVDSGYLIEAGRKTVISKYGKEKSSSPYFSLTESGLMWVLSSCDMQYLINNTHEAMMEYGIKTTRAQLGFDNMAEATAKAFTNFLTPEVLK